MQDNFPSYESLMTLKTLNNLDPDEALNYLGHLTNLSLHLQRIEGINHVIKLAEIFEKKILNSQQLTNFYYILGNAWGNKKDLTRKNNTSIWDWEQEEAEKQIFYYRSALKEEGFKNLAKDHQCSILTNLGNLLSTIGRFIEAIEYFNRAINIVPLFAMAHGNNAKCLRYYSPSLYDKNHSALLLKYAHKQLKTAIEGEFYNNEFARTEFEKLQREIESILSSEYLAEESDINKFSLGNSEEEISYRRWCLKQCLFLNPLNDLGAYSIAANDILTTPDIIVKAGEGPSFQGFFNQIKQEFVSARYLYYEGINSTSPHFSDNQVEFFNTLDYPSYSLAVEKVKITFRICYSLFDKIANFLNYYLELSIKPRKVNFKTLWYKSQDKKQKLRDDLKQYKNWPMRGLFWLSKDLYNEVIKHTTEPDAQEIYEIRNQIEHNYFKLHENNFPQPHNDMFKDNLSLSRYRHDFETKTLRILKLTRAAIIYLSLSIQAEERHRVKRRNLSENDIAVIDTDLIEGYFDSSMQKLQ